MPPKLSPSDTNDLIRRYLAGESMNELGPIFGISGRTVTDYLRRAGIKARTRQEGLQLAADKGKWRTPEARANRSAAMRKRWAEATPEQRAAMLDPAHEGGRRPRSPETIQRMLAAKKGSDSIYEQQVADWLTERNQTFRQQVVMGDYCADLSIGPILVEVTTGWARKKDWAPRFSRFFDEGWHLYVIWHDTRIPLLPVVADDLISWAKILEASPPESCQHQVIWRSRQILSTGGGDGDYVAGILRSSTPRGDWPLYNRPRD